MANRADELWIVWGRVNTVQFLSSQDLRNAEDIFLMSQGSRTKASSSPNRTSSPGSSTSSSSSSECWYHRKWGNQANKYRSPFWIFVLTPVVPQEQLSSAKFLVDTGECVSVFPRLPCSPSASGSGIQWEPLTVPLWTLMVPAILCQSWVQISYATTISWSMLQVPTYLTPQALNHFI